MNVATAYAIAALIFFGLSDFFYKRAATVGVRPHHFLMAQACIFSPSIFVAALLTHALVWQPAALWGSLAGLFTFVAFYSFSRSLATGSVSINAPIFRLNFVVTAVLAIWLLNEPLTFNKVIGLVFALLAAWLLLGGATSDSRTCANLSGRSLRLIGVATLALGAANFCHKLGLQHGVLPITMMTAQAAVFVTLSIVSSYSIDRRIAPPAVTWRYGIIAAVLLLLAFLCMLRGLAQGEASVLVPIAQMGFVVTAILGIALLGESLTVRKGVGLGMALAALAILSWH